MELDSRFLRGLGYGAWVCLLLLLIAYAAAVGIAVLSDNIEDDRAPALLTALAVLNIVAGCSALSVVVQRLRRRSGSRAIVAGPLLTCATLLLTCVLLVVGYAGTGRT